MRRSAVLLAALLTIPSFAQTSTPTTGSGSATPPATNSLEASATDNLQTSAGHRPGTIVSDAIATHVQRKSARLQAQRDGDTTVLLDPAFADSGGGSSGSSGGLGDLLGGLLGGSGGLGDLLGGSLGGLLGGGSTNNSNGNGNNGNSDSNGGNSNIPSNITPEVLQLLQQFGIDPSQVFGDSSAAKLSSQAQDNSGGGSTDSEPRFRTRLADALLDQLFTSLSLGLRSPPFISVIADALRPIFIPDSANTDQGDGAGA